MSSYFDAAAREVAELNEDLVGDEFVEAVTAIENRVIGEVLFITGDREFPDALREKILGNIAVRAVNFANVENEKVRLRVEMNRRSLVIEDLHDDFHDVARSKTVTRFGKLSDHPVFDRHRRDEHDSR